MIYSFRHKEDHNNIVTLEMPMAEREPWLANNPDFEQIIVTCTIVDPMMVGVYSPDVANFNKNVLGRMKDAIPNNNLHHSRFNQNVGEI